MSSIQRRFGLLFGAALLAMAFVAPSAFAIVDFPHEQEASKWTGVAIYDYNGSLEKSQQCDEGAAGNADCSFSDSGACKKVTFGILISCTASWSGDLGWTGKLSATTSKEIPANVGSICQHKTTQELWIRMDNGSGGVFFGYIKGDPSGVGAAPQPIHPRAVLFGMPGGLTKTTTSTSYFGVEFSSMWDEKELLMGGAKEAACAWPEL